MILFIWSADMYRAPTTCQALLARTKQKKASCSAVAGVGPQISSSLCFDYPHKAGGFDSRNSGWEMTLGALSKGKQMYNSDIGVYVHDWTRNVMIDCLAKSELWSQI